MVPLTARFGSEADAYAAAGSLQALGSEASVCSEDDFGFDLDFVQHPLATSLVAILACGWAGVLIGAIASGVVPGVSGWVVGAVPAPVVIGGAAAAVGGLTALLICRSALPDYRPSRSLTFVRASVPPARVDEATRTLLRRLRALDVRVGSRPGHREVAGG